MLVLIPEPAQKAKHCYFKSKLNSKTVNWFKNVLFLRFHPRGNIGFLDFCPKKFYNIDNRNAAIRKSNLCLQPTNLLLLIPTHNAHFCLFYAASPTLPKFRLLLTNGMRTFCNIKFIIYTRLGPNIGYWVTQLQLPWHTICYPTYLGMGCGDFSEWGQMTKK